MTIAASKPASRRLGFRIASLALGLVAVTTAGFAALSLSIMRSQFGDQTVDWSSFSQSLGLYAQAGLMFFLAAVFVAVGLVLSVPAIVLGIVALVRGASVMPIAGIVLGGCALAWIVVMSLQFAAGGYFPVDPRA